MSIIDYRAAPDRTMSPKTAVAPTATNPALYDSAETRRPTATYPAACPISMIVDSRTSAAPRLRAGASPATKDRIAAWATWSPMPEMHESTAGSLAMVGEMIASSPTTDRTRKSLCDCRSGLTDTSRTRER